MMIVKLAVDLPGFGLGLYATAVFQRGDVVGIYENAKDGQRLNVHRVKNANKSQYALEHEDLVRDAWDSIEIRPLL